MLENLSWDGRVAEERKFCEPGIYTGTITDWKFGKSDVKKTDFLELQLKTDSGAATRKTFYLTEKTMPIVARQMIDLGRPFNEVAELLTLDFKNLKVKFKVEQDGKYTNVKWVVASKEEVGTPAVNKTAEKPKAEDDIPF